jgi:hypothetical protein
MIPRGGAVMTRSTVLCVALFVLSAMTLHCGLGPAPQKSGSGKPSAATGALLGHPDPALIRLMVRANVAPR